MKRANSSRTAVTETAPTPFGDNLMEIQAQNRVKFNVGLTEITERPHILTRRAARWARRANH